MSPEGPVPVLPSPSGALGCMVQRRHSYVLAVATLVAWGVFVDGGCDLPPHARPSDPVISAVAPLRRLRRLSNREYDNVVRDLLGDGSHPAYAFLADVYQNGYDNGSVGLAVQSDQVASYQVAAEALAARVLADNRAAVLGDCDPDVDGGDACLDRILTS